VGIGYILKPTFFLPPLMFTQTEMESLLLGTRWVIQYGDAPLSKAATDALNKILDVLPNNIKNDANAFSLRVGPPASKPMAEEDLSGLRDAIANQKKIYMVYKSEYGKETTHIVCPFTIGYFTNERILVAWCDKQKNYQHFKTNRISAIEILSEHYSGSKDKLFREWQALQLRKHSTRRK
jgi:predicted DNA-binding transcriptional regulator YafY